MDIVLATGNEGKLEAFRRLLAGLPCRLLSPKDVGLTIEVDENGATFAANALLKARAYRDASGLAALADDSGLCVEALDGAPGLHSARFGGVSHSPAKQNELLLDMMRSVPAGRRNAEFVSAIAFAARDGEEWTVEGRIPGEISTRVTGTNGFGYDPVFLVPELGKTFGEMAPEEKDPISHRGIAMQSARSRLEARLTLLK